MKTELRTITPEWAQRVLLDNNKKNRNVSRKRINQYARDMKMGQWKLTHQGIAFYDNGELADGQHRLAAVVESGQSIQVLVTEGIPIDSKNGVITTVDAIDTGYARSVGQQLQLSHGVKCACGAAACMNQIALLIMPGIRRSPSVALTLDMLNIYGKGFEDLFDSNDPVTRRSFVMAPIVMYYKTEPSRATDFYHQMATMEGLSSAVRVCRRWVERHHHKGNGPDTAKVVASCLRYFHNNEPMFKIYPSDEGRNWLGELSPIITRRVRSMLAPLTTKGMEKVDAV